MKSSLPEHVTANHVSLIAGFLIALVVGYVVLSTAVSPGLENYVNDSAEWCEERGGDLVNANVIGEHGGLHCELPNGTSVHMSEVVTPRSESG